MPELTSDRISLVAASLLPGIVERADRLLTHAIKFQSRLGERFRMGTPELLSVTYSQDGHEVEYLARFLKDEGLINRDDLAGHIQITLRGYMRYETLQVQPSASAQGFVAMWFHDSMREAYLRGFEVGIRQAGYDPLRSTASSMSERSTTRSLHRSDALGS